MKALPGTLAKSSIELAVTKKHFPELITMTLFLSRSITELIKATRTSHAANLAFCGDSNSNLALFLHCDRTCHAAPKGLTKEIIKRLEPERIQQILEPLIVTAGLFPFHETFKQKKSSNAAFSNLSRRPGNVFLEAPLVLLSPRKV